MILADEVLTPDSSRFWPADQYKPGRPQPSYDKQYVRDYLESIHWNKQPPAPALPGGRGAPHQRKIQGSLSRCSPAARWSRVAREPARPAAGAHRRRLRRGGIRGRIRARRHRIHRRRLPAWSSASGFTAYPPPGSTISSFSGDRPTCSGFLVVFWAILVIGALVGKAASPTFQVDRTLLARPPARRRLRSGARRADRRGALSPCCWPSRPTYAELDGELASCCPTRSTRRMLFASLAPTVFKDAFRDGHGGAARTGTNNCESAKAQGTGAARRPSRRTRSQGEEEGQMNRRPADFRSRRHSDRLQTKTWSDSVNAMLAWTGSGAPAPSTVSLVCRQRRAHAVMRRALPELRDEHLPMLCTFSWITTASTCWTPRRSIQASARRSTACMRAGVASGRADQQAGPLQRATGRRTRPGDALLPHLRRQQL